MSSLGSCCSRSGIDQDDAWEAGAKAYAVGLLADEELARYAQRLAERGDRVSLAMTLLKLTSPGVPDIYQGDELPFFALVDPDNRRPVDWDERRRALASDEPPQKLDVIRRALALRKRRPAAFGSTYEPVEAGSDVITFVRGGQVLVAVAIRGDLAGFEPPGAKWGDVLRTPHLLLAERA